MTTSFEIMFPVIAGRLSRRRFLVAGAAGSVAILAGGVGPALAADKPKVGLVMKSLANEFFKQMQAGADKYAAANADKFDFKAVGMKDERDFAAQVDAIENFVTQKFNVIVIAPADSKAMVTPIAKALKAGVKVINIDVELDGDAKKAAGIDLAFFGPDNRAGAKLAGDALAAKLGPGGKVVILEGNPEAALLFYWEPLGRQVRVEGAVTRTTAAESDEYYASRDVRSRIGAYASHQSRPIASEKALEAAATSSSDARGNQTNSLSRIATSCALCSAFMSQLNSPTSSPPCICAVHAAAPAVLTPRRPAVTRYMPSQGLPASCRTLPAGKDSCVAPSAKRASVASSTPSSAAQARR